MARFDAVAARAALAELHEQEAHAVVRELAQRRDAHARTRAALRQLAEVGSPEGLLERAAAQLGEAAGWDRVLIGDVHGDTLTPRALWERDAEHGEPPGLAVRLAYPLVEAEVAASAGAQLVDGAASARRCAVPLREAFGWRAYIVAALRLRGATIGLLHADADRSGRALGPLDRELAALCADGLAAAFEVATLRHALQRHRDAQRTAVRQLGGSLEQAGDAAAAPRADVVVQAADPLTAREQEVLDLLARGLTNRAIAQRLTIGEGTVKYHVKNVLRKLRATSRADAVARYHRQRG